MKNNTICGLGSDIVEIERIRESYQKYGARFLNRIFTLEEQAYCLQFKDPAPHLAARFCAKEAIAKALGTGIGASLRWLDMHILRDTQGKPYVQFAPLSKSYSVLISMSHCRLYALATALWIAD